MISFVGWGEAGGDEEFSLEDESREFFVDVWECCCVSPLSRTSLGGGEDTVEFWRDILPMVRATTIRECENLLLRTVGNSFVYYIFAPPPLIDMMVFFDDTLKDLCAANFIFQECK